MFRRTLQEKQLILAGLLVVLLAASFWVSSRYPALSDKALMGGGLTLEDPLSFEAVFPIYRGDSVFTKIVSTTVNWLYTNKEGMSFGLLFAAALMTLLAVCSRYRPAGRFANTLLGVVIGTPLGVCVNCAVPIAKGLHASGERLETTLAAMLSSPTFNIVVLTMLFALFPPYIAFIKLGLSLVFIVFGIPLLSRWVFSTEAAFQTTSSLNTYAPTSSWTVPPPLELNSFSSSETWCHAVRWLGQTFGRNVWFILKTTLPFMILTGFLGAVVITLLPWNFLADILPQSNRLLVLLSMGLVACIGVFLPVPMAFDVIIAALLLATGMPIKYVMVLLFSLGIFSIYAFMSVWQMLSKQVAITLFLGVAGCAMAAGGSAHLYEKWDLRYQQRVLFQAFSQSPRLTRPASPVPYPVTEQELVPSLQSQALSFQPVVVNGPANITVGQMLFRDRMPQSGPLFQKFPGVQFGLKEPNHFSILKFYPVFSTLRGIAAGDVHNDGWSDLLLTTPTGLSLYANQGGSGYTRQQLAIPLLSEFFVGHAALVDLNNDGWLDIFFSAFRQGHYVIYNDHGQFRADGLQPLPPKDAILAGAVSFGDVDRDGDLDIVLGQVSTRQIVDVSPKVARNVVLRNDGESFHVRPLEGMHGETLSTLLTDYNHDGNLDLIVGNDYSPPDFYYLGDGSGRFHALTRDTRIIPHSTLTTMTIDSADINNDLRLELYAGHIARGTAAEEAAYRKRMQPVHLRCEAMTAPALRQRCLQQAKWHHVAFQSQQRRNALSCQTITDPIIRQECIAASLYWMALGQRPGLCELLGDAWPHLSFLCHQTVAAPPQLPPAAFRNTIPQQQGYNVLLMPTETGRFVDRAQAMGVGIGGWTWNAKFADVDNDGWQDLYLVNGWFGEEQQESNYFYHNQQGKQFVDTSAAFGLQDFLATGAFTYVDMDHDGDLDIITVPFADQPQVFVNTSAQGHAIAFELRDYVGNAFGIGSTIIIDYGSASGQQQMREIKAGGGYLSYDPPVAFFGMGPTSEVQQVEVVWSTGEHTQLQGPFSVGARYRITRRG